MIFPYVKGLSEEVRQVLNNLNLDILYTVPNRLNGIIKNVVYKINCKDCAACYIGQTKRHLEKRIKEHRNNIKRHESNYSVISNHRISYNHDFDWEFVSILHNEINIKKREIVEMIFIKKQNNAINLQRDTDNLNPIYNTIIDSL